MVIGLWKAPTSRGRDPTRRLDYLGAGSAMLMIGGFVYAINRLPVDGATLLTVGAVLVAVLGGTLFASRSKRHPAPFIPRRSCRIAGFGPW